MAALETIETFESALLVAYNPGAKHALGATLPLRIAARTAQPCAASTRVTQI